MPLLVQLRQMPLGERTYLSWVRAGAPRPARDTPAPAAPAAMSIVGYGFDDAVVWVRGL